MPCKLKTFSYPMSDNSPNNTISGRDNFELEVGHVVLVSLKSDLNYTQT